MLAKLSEIAVKIFDLAKYLIPLVAIFEFFRVLFSKFTDLILKWINARLDQVWNLVKGQMEALSVDLSPGSEFSSWIAKINVVIPLSEMWHYFLLYLGVASVVLGVKWMRNLVPGLK